MSLYLCSTPRSGRVGIGALVILLVLIFEGKHTNCAVQSHAGVGNPLVGLGPWEIERIGVDSSQGKRHSDEGLHGDEERTQN